MNNKGKAKTKIHCSTCPEWEIVDPNTAPTLTVAGKKHYFCNADCLDQFKKTKKP